MPAVEFAEGALRDLELIFEHLTDAYRGFGEAHDEAAEHAARRIRGIVRSAGRIAAAPNRGATHDDLGPGVRHLTLDRAIYYFLLDGETVRVLAVFFGGQDHQRRMRLRLLQG
jgi:plasmid stabilization system protein ParE